MKITSNTQPNHQPAIMGLQHQITSEPIEKKILHKRKSLLDLKSLLEDRGGTIEDRYKEECDQATYDDGDASNNRVYRLDDKPAKTPPLSPHPGVNSVKKGPVAQLETPVNASSYLFGDCENVAAPQSGGARAINRAPSERRELKTPLKTRAHSPNILLRHCTQRSCEEAKFAQLATSFV
ncbi:unnamed protein product, partial [Iphiclides podalirius]